MRPGPSDEQLLRMMREVEDVEDAVEPVAQEADEVPDLDLCPACGEPAEHLDVCRVCETEGCLPRDEWRPGMRDPCLTVCVRCARSLHLACAAEDEAGNPRCATCHY